MDAWSTAADSFGGDEAEPVTDVFCNCRSQRRGSWAGMRYVKPALFSRPRFASEEASTMPQQRRKSSSHRMDSNICPSCGKRLLNTFGSTWDRPRLTRTNSTIRGTSLKDTALEDPQHAKALLQATDAVLLRICDVFEEYKNAAGPNSCCFCESGIVFSQ